MNKRDFITAELPEHWACALLYGDDSGLDSRDEKALDKFVDHMVASFGACLCVNVESDDSGDFRHYHDASDFGALACNVAVFTFDVTKGM